MNILITGANGFIGSHVMNQLSKNSNLKPIGLVRKTSNLFRLENKNYNLRFGSIENNLENILSDIDTVVHIAGKASDWGKYEDFFKTNYEGTLNILKQSIDSGVRRFIHFSSTVVYGFNGNINTKEDSPFKPFNNYYCITKTMAEKEIWKYRDRIEIIVIRPSNVYGPEDYSFTFPLIKTMEKGLIGFVNGGKPLTSPCYVKNLAYATELAVITDKGMGEAFNISDSKDIPWIEFLKIFADELGAKTPKLNVPSFLLMGIAKIMETIYRMAGSKRPPFLTPYRIAISAKDYSFSTEKAERIMGYSPPYSTTEGVRESVEWYKNIKTAS